MQQLRQHVFRAWRRLRGTTDPASGSSSIFPAAQHAPDFRIYPAPSCRVTVSLPNGRVLTSRGRRCVYRNCRESHPPRGQACVGLHSRWTFASLLPPFCNIHFPKPYREARNRTSLLRHLCQGGALAGAGLGQYWLLGWEGSPPHDPAPSHVVREELRLCGGLALSAIRAQGPEPPQGPGKDGYVAL